MSVSKWEKEALALDVEVKHFLVDQDGRSTSYFFISFLSLPLTVKRDISFVFFNGSPSNLVGI